MQAKSQGLILSILLQILLTDPEYPSGLCFLPLARWNPGQWGVTKEMALLADVLLPALNLAKASLSVAVMLVLHFHITWGGKGLQTLQDSQGQHMTYWEVQKDDGFYYQVVEL